MKSCLLLFCAAVLSAQTTLTLTGPPSARAGAIIPMTLTLASSLSGSARPAGLQWVLGYPAGHTATLTPGTSAVNKALSCTADNSFCLLIGSAPPNVSTIPNGPVATYSLKIPATTTGNVSVPMLNATLGTDPLGAAITITSGAIYSFTVLARQDLNSDGSVTVADVQLMVNQVIAAQSTPAACLDDLNGDGRCDLLDVFNVLLKAIAP